MNERIAGLTRRRLDNLAAILTKAERLSAAGDAFPNGRVTARVLNDATLYDDDVMQTYVAGLLAGSRNDDGSDDRPVFYLSLIDGLTAEQLGLFHVLYCGLLCAAGGDYSAKDPAGVRVRIDVDEVDDAMDAFGPSAVTDDTVVFALEHVGLITGLSIKTYDDGIHRIEFFGTRIGALLFDWAHAVTDSSPLEFFQRERPADGPLKVTLPSAVLV